MVDPAPLTNPSNDRNRIGDFCTRTGPAILLSLVLFIGGITLLAIRLPGWSLFLGLPATQIGIILLILTFDSCFKKQLDPQEIISKKCRLCQNQITNNESQQKPAVCAECRSKIMIELAKKRI